MAILGSLLAVVFALAFGAVAVLVIWGGFDMLQQEVTPGFKVAPGTSGGRVLTLLGLIIGILGVAVLSAYSAIAFLAMGLGMNSAL